MFAAKPIDTRNLNSALHSLARYSGAAIEDVVEFEAGKILEGAIRHTDAATVSKIRDHENNRDFRTLDAGHGRKTYNLNWRFPDAVWNKIEAARKASLERKLKARGLSKQSWQMLADLLGLIVKAPAYVRRAIASTGQRYPQNAAVRKSRTADKFGIFLSNKQPTVGAINGRTALLKAINGRVAYFRTSLRKGVFTDLAKIAARYKGLRLR